MKVHSRLLPFLILAAVTFTLAGDALSTKVLDNGLQVIVVENHTVPLVTIEVVLRNGSFTETPEKDGLTNLHAHMFFKANKTFPTREACLERTRELGIVSGIRSGEEWEAFYLTLPVDSLKQGLDFMSESIQNPIFSNEALGREKQVILNEIDREAANPSYHRSNAVRAKLWGQNVSRKNYLGNRSVIRSASLEQVRLIQKHYVIPNNASLLVSGDVRPREVFSLAEDLFGSWEAGPDPSRASPVPPYMPLEASLDTVVVQPINNAQIVMAWHGPSVMADVKGTFAADVFSFILNQRTSVLQKNLMDSGIALEVEVYYLTQKHIGPIFITVTCRPQKFWEAYQALQDEIEKFDDTDYFTDEQLTNAKTLLEVAEVFKGDKASALVREVAFWWAVAGLDYYRDYLDNLRAVSRDDILDYVRRYIIGQPHVVAAMMNRQTRQQLQVLEGRLAK
ncbi:MAG: insulinase family protein [Fidelibacterota bacterium]|nr:MAG: insulinase family protein [Candidatus Neomarinimicrobiota bacterium]